MEKQFTLSKTSNPKINKNFLLLNHLNKRVLLKMIDTLLLHQPAEDEQNCNKDICGKSKIDF